MFWGSWYVIEMWNFELQTIILAAMAILLVSSELILLAPRKPVTWGAVQVMGSLAGDEVVFLADEFHRNTTLTQEDSVGAKDLPLVLVGNDKQHLKLSLFMCTMSTPSFLRILTNSNSSLHLEGDDGGWWWLGWEMENGGKETMVRKWKWK